MIKVELVDPWGVVAPGTTWVADIGTSGSVTYQPPVFGWPQGWQLQVTAYEPKPAAAKAGEGTPG